MSTRIVLPLIPIVLAAVTASTASAQLPAQAPAAAAPYVLPGYVVPPPPPPPPVMLGINMEVAYIQYGGRWEPGLRVINVWPGYPAYGVLDPGDIITRVNGMRVRNVPEFRHAMAYAGPSVNLRLWNVRTGLIQDIVPLYLGGYGSPGYPAAAAAPSATAPAPSAPASPPHAATVPAPAAESGAP